MRMYIKEWPNKTAALMLENGSVLFTFHSVDAALCACRDWHHCNVSNAETNDDTQDYPVTFVS